MDWGAIDWVAASAFMALSALTTWGCTRLTRNGGSRGTPHWDAATRAPIEFGRNSLAPTACQHSPVIVGELTLCVHCGRGM